NRHERVPPDRGLADPERDPGRAEERHDHRAGPRECEPPTPAIEEADDPLRVPPLRDVPHEEPAQLQREPDQWIAPRADREEPLVDGRPLLAEEAVRAERGGEPCEAVQREDAAL